MRNVRLIIGLSVLVTCLAGVPAEGTEWGKDPFFPSTSRPAAPTPSPDDKDWGRDPFDNPFGRKTTYQQPGARNLTGIIYGKTVRLAIIGGEVLDEGSTVGDQRLVDIRRKSVVLMNKAGRMEELFLVDFSLGQ